jgi:hypothetical protein
MRNQNPSAAPRKGARKLPNANTLAASTNRALVAAAYRQGVGADRGPGWSSWRPLDRKSGSIAGCCGDRNRALSYPSRYRPSAERSPRLACRSSMWCSCEARSTKMRRVLVTPTHDSGGESVVSQACSVQPSITRARLSLSSTRSLRAVGGIGQALHRVPVRPLSVAAAPSGVIARGSAAFTVSRESWLTYLLSDTARCPQQPSVTCEASVGAKLGSPRVYRVLTNEKPAGSDVNAVSHPAHTIRLCGRSFATDYRNLVRFRAQAARLGRRASLIARGTPFRRSGFSSAAPW